MSNINRYFFEQTNELHDQIISLHDFVLPAATALWNFRGVITNELATNPAVTVAELSTKFNKAPGSRGTTNLIVPFRDVPWDSQKERLAEIALVNIIALFEIWCEEICGLFGRDDIAIKLQFPSNPTRSGGVGFALDQIIGNYSGPITASIYPSLIRSKQYSLPTLDNLLKCFRYFKELRNCFMHRGADAMASCIAPNRTLCRSPTR